MAVARGPKANAASNANLKFKRGRNAGKPAAYPGAKTTGGARTSGS